MQRDEAGADALRKLVCLLAEENPVFQLHVLETIQDALESRDTQAAALKQLHTSFLAPTLEAFIAALPTAHGSLPESGPLQDLLLLSEGSGLEMPVANIAALVAGELLHRRAWEDALARYPDTLRVLKERLS